MATVNALLDEGILVRPRAADLHTSVVLSSVLRIRPVVEELGDLKFARDEASLGYHLSWGRILPVELLPAFIREVRIRLAQGDGQAGPVEDSMQQFHAVSQEQRQRVQTQQLEQQPQDAREQQGSHARGMSMG
jgi:hypothetical protein